MSDRLDKKKKKMRGDQANAFRNCIMSQDFDIMEMEKHLLRIFRNKQVKAQSLMSIIMYKKNHDKHYW